MPSNTKRTDKWEELSESIAEYLEKLPFSVLSLSLNCRIIDTQAFIRKNFKVVPRYKYILNLDQSLECIWRNIESKKRNQQIIKGEKDGLRSVKTEDYSLILMFVDKTFSRQNMTIEKRYIEKIIFEFLDKNNSVLYVTYDDNKPIAGVLFIYDKYSSHGFLSGYDHTSKHNGALSMCFWECIKYCKEIKLKYFDFEGSMIPRFEKYLRGFGGELTPYYVIHKAKLPCEIILKFFKREIF